MRKIITLLLTAVIWLPSAYAQKGILKIKIRDEENFNLPGASVLLVPGNFYGFTNQSGEVAFTGLPAGEYKLSVTYIGYSSLEKNVKVSNNTVEITERLMSGIKTEKEVIVLGDRLKGQSKALNQQKNNPNVSNIVSADQIGRFPDANIGDAIKRVPGITMQNDQGEARNIIVRGMGPELNAVTLNGERIPSAEGDNRRVQLDLVPSDMVQTVEVSKTLTPEMDADAIGGSVNLISRTPSNGLRVSGMLSGGYNVIRKGFIGNSSIVVGNRFAQNKIGFMLSGSFNVNDYGSDNVEAVWSKDNSGKLYVSDHDIRKYDVKRTRRAASATFDIKLNPRNTIYLTGTYNWRDDLENRFRLRHRARGTVSNLLYNAEGNITGYTNGEVLRQTKAGIDSDRGKSRRLEDQRVRTLALKGEHIFGKIKFDWNGQYARASEIRPNERYISMGRRSITVNQDINDIRLPLLTDTRALTDYTRLNELTEEFQDQYEEDFNAKFNFEVPSSLVKNQKGALRAGARLRSKTKIRNNSFFSYSPAGTNAANFANITLLQLSDESVSRFYPGSKYVVGQFIDAGFFGRMQLKDPALFEESDEPAEYLAGNYKASERIYAGYVQFSQQFSDKFSAIAGVRVEHTAINYTGNIVEDEDNLKGTATIKNDFTSLLPNLNLKYVPAKDFVLRAALTSAIARPKYYDLVPYFNVNPGDMELSSGNPKLEAIRSTNFDLMAEKYFKSVGIVSAGVFYKHLSNFFYTYRDENYTAEKFAADFPTVENPIAAGDSWQFTQRRNGSNVDVIGFEVALQRQFDFLPGFWKGFGLYTNYTFTSSKAKGIYDGSGSLIRENVKLPGTAPHMFNASLSYENKKVVVRLSGNFTAAYVDDSDDAGYNEDAFFDRYYDKQFFLDANASFAVTKKLRLFAEANNITNQPLRYYQGEKDRTAQLEYYGPRYNFGVKFDLIK
ncbi:MAG TPA: TonB-dependent receptor [Chitinophagaceae bacterium]|nr:TonB-dependent receptor [Chitinophagaceae bacterium]